MTSQQFQEWFVDVLDAMYPVRDCGMAAFMLTLPLLERYVRQRAFSAPKDKFDHRCQHELLTLFPNLVDLANAGAFWKAYRHGYLHQVTNSPFDQYKNVALPTAALTHDIRRAIQLKPGAFYVHPVLFSQAVISPIRADFARFSGSGKLRAGATHSRASPALPRSAMGAQHGRSVGSPDVLIIRPRLPLEVAAHRVTAARPRGLGSSRTRGCARSRSSAGSARAR